MNRHRTIGVLVPTDGAAPTTPPEDRPIGRAALMLASQGIDVIFGDTVIEGRISGHRAVSGGWEGVTNIAVDGIHDRYPSQIRAEHWFKIQTGLAGAPMGNPLEFTMLCRDKVYCQERLVSQGIRMPDIETDPRFFEERLAEWGTAFLKPQYGALGIGVQQVQPGDPLPSHCDGVVPKRPDPAILQRAVPPQTGWAGRAVRVLVQRTPDGGWFQGVPVLRQSRVDPVVNAARGAEVAPGPRFLSTRVLQFISEEADRICAALDRIPEARRMVEAGVDLVLDSQEEPWLIEVNSRPRGRLEMLADTEPDEYMKAHITGCARPIQVIAGWS